MRPKAKFRVGQFVFCRNERSYIRISSRHFSCGAWFYWKENASMGWNERELRALTKREHNWTWVLHEAQMLAKNRMGENMESKTVKAVDKMLVKLEKEVDRLKLVLADVRADLRKHYPKDK